MPLTTYLQVFLASNQTLNPEQLAILEAQLPLALRRALPDSNYRGYITVHPSGNAAAVALGRVAQTQVLPHDVIERLADVAFEHRSIPGRAEILKGLAAHWYGRGSDVGSAAVKRLREAGESDDRRVVEIEVAATALRAIPLGERQTSIGVIEQQWIDASEPELRIALARLIAMSSLPQWTDQ